MKSGEIVIRRGEMADIPYLQPIERAATGRFRGHPAFESFWAQDFSPSSSRRASCATARSGW